jgi:hypothetical protein
LYRDQAGEFPSGLAPGSVEGRLPVADSSGRVSAQIDPELPHVRPMILETDASSHAPTFLRRCLVGVKSRYALYGLAPVGALHL